MRSIIDAYRGSLEIRLKPDLIEMQAERAILPQITADGQLIMQPRAQFGIKAYCVPAPFVGEWCGSGAIDISVEIEMNRWIQIDWDIELPVQDIKIEFSTCTYHQNSRWVRINVIHLMRIHTYTPVIKVVSWGAELALFMNSAAALEV